MKKILIISAFIIIFSGCIKHITYTPYMTGDCVDRIVETRQDLRKQGYETRLILGIVQDDEKRFGHAWVEYRDKKTDEWKRINNY